MKLTVKERVAIDEAAMVVAKAGFVFLTDGLSPWGHQRAKEVRDILRKINARSRAEETNELKEEKP